MYNYVFFASEEDYLRVAYSDIFNLKNVYYQSEFLYSNTKFKKFLFMVHYSSKLNSIHKIPFKKMWFPYHYNKNHFKNSNKYIFVFFFKWRRVFDAGYLEYLRNEYPNCKCVLFLQDINNAKTLDIKKEKERFDHIMVFEKFFAKEHEIEYYPLVYSEGLINLHYNTRIYDLVFIGGAKGRYKTIKSISEKLKMENLKYCFYISGMQRPTDETDKNIHFVNYLPYEENIRILKQSKCILDIVPPHTNCNTLRMSEAICYQNRVITNNIHIVEESFYDPKLISVYTNPLDIDIDFIKAPYENINYRNRYDISPIALLKHLEQI